MVYETPDEFEAAADAAGVKMRKVCAIAGIANSTWYRWKNAEMVPSIDVVRRLRDALDQLKAA